MRFFKIYISGGREFEFFLMSLKPPQFEIQYFDHGDQKQIKLFVSSLVCEHLRRSLSLLTKGLSSHFVIEGKRKKPTLLIGISNRDSSINRGGAAAKDIFNIYLTPDSLGFIEEQLLRYSRHQKADTDHIDLEFLLDESSAYLTLCFDSYEAPVSEHEARKRLGL